MSMSGVSRRFCERIWGDFHDFNFNCMGVEFFGTLLCMEFLRVCLLCVNMTLAPNFLIRLVQAWFFTFRSGTELFEELSPCGAHE